MAEIRKAVEGDIDALITLLYDMHDETDYKFFKVNENKARYALLRWLIQTDAVMFVAEEKGELIGVVAGSVFTPWFSDDDKVMEQLFFVKQEHRGSGVAFILFEKFLEWAKEQCNYVSAGVTTSVGEAAESIYKRFGMSYTGSNFAMLLNV